MAKFEIPLDDYEKILYGDSKTVEKYKAKFEKKYRRTCKYCGEKYIAKTARKSFYCDKCNRIAPTTNHKKSIRDDEALKLYSKVYQRIYRRDGSVNDELIDMRKQYKWGHITKEKFVDYLTKNK